MKRALMTATVPSMIGQFNMNNIKILLELGYKVDIACNFNDYSVWNEERINKFENELKELNIETFNISFSRSPKDIKSLINSYKQMKQLLNEKKYTLVHTHTPISSLITRLAYKKSDIYETCKMIYTAHGFHFFKGNNPLKNFIFRNIEKYGAKYTDVLITINKEDYEAAKKFKLKKNGTVEYIPGVGIDIEKINSIKGNKVELCKELNLPEDSTLLLSVGELNENKNHKVVIECLPQLPNNTHYLICGVGPLKEQHEQLAKELHVEDRLHLLGYRTDVIKIMKSCDIFVFPSKREGLSVALMEAMACGLPCVASNIRGNEDLIKNFFNGFLVENNKEMFLEYLQKIKPCFALNNKEYIKQYDSKLIENKMLNLYNNGRVNSNIKRKKIFFVSGSMSKGGAERVLSNIANHLEDHDVYILTLLQFNSDYFLKPNVQLINIAKSGAYFKNVIFWIKNIRKNIKKYQPDVILSFAGRINLLTIISNMGFKNKLVVSERNDPNNDGRSHSMISLTNFLYRFTDIVVFQTKYAKSIFDESIQKKALVIPNPINPELLKISSKNKVKKIVTVGRLEYQKNQQLLINAVAKLHEKYPEYTLEIYGKGTLFEDLNNLINELNANSYIYLRGQVDNIYECIKNASLFVLPSRFEGVSNALLEAMMLGIPCVTSNYPGSEEIIQHNVNGYLFENEDLNSLFDVLDYALSKDNYEVVENANETMENFNPKKVLNDWENVLIGGKK